MGTLLQDHAFLDSIFQNSELRLKICTDVYHDSDWYESSYYIDYDIWLVTKGTLKIVLEGKKYYAAPGDAVFFFPGLLYSASTGEQGCHFIYMHFDLYTGHDPRGLDILDISGYIPANMIKKEFEIFQSNYRSFKEHLPLSFFSLKGSMILLLCAISTYRYSEGSKPVAQKKISRLYPALRYISDSFRSKIPISDLAGICGMSEKYFITLFRKSIGVTPGHYIVELRMRKALEYIDEQRYSVKEISYMLGYPDQYSFSKAFSRYYGTAPSKYRI